MSIYKYIKYHLKKISQSAISNYQKFLSKYFLKNFDKDFKKIIIENRLLLEQESPFINKEIYLKNKYGIQERIFKKINEPINCELFYSDIIVYLTKKYFPENLSYLEIGGSVLKNALLVTEATENSTIVIFDINEINPLKKDRFFNNKKNENIYFQGSVLSKKDINRFNIKIKRKFNFVFSDALHTPEGLIQEFKYIYGSSLKEKFIIYFDDLDFPELLDTAKVIAFELKEKYPNVEFLTFKTFGWIGSNEPMHLNGLITNINIFNDLKVQKFNLFRFKKVKI